MSGLLGPDGRPISSSKFSGRSSGFKKATPPALGEKHGQWGGEPVKYLQLPGGGFLQFNLDSLNMGDFRQMKDHYQINSSLAILTFMMHQVEWHIECDDKRIAKEAEEQLTEIWSRLVRAMSQSFWAGYSPNVLQWQNDVKGRRIVLDKIKDLVPDDCRVHWKTEEGGPGNRTRISPKIKIYDGIDQIGWPNTIPTENSFWYPLLMENGNYYGRKLLRPAFQPWFFSILIHLFANRYFERFGEPTPIGRAPYDDTVTFGNEEIAGNKLMEIMLSQIRNRSVVVLPNDKSPNANETNPDFDYQIEYLESAMRGADFEKYMTRLDEEISLALFTPILMMRTADVGSYNLGVGHTQTYMWMLNAITGDWAQYINRYILQPIARYNFSENAPPVRIRFRKLGKENQELVRDILTQGYRDGKLKFNLLELSEMSGMSITEVRELNEEPSGPKGDQPVDEDGDPTSRGNGGKDKEVGTKEKIVARVRPQVERAYRRGEMPDRLNIDIGHQRELRSIFADSSVGMAGAKVFENTMLAYVEEICTMKDQYPDANEYMSAFSSAMSYEIERLKSRG